MTGVNDVNSDRKGVVSSLLLPMGERPGNESSKHKLERPISKIVVLLESNGV